MASAVRSVLAASYLRWSVVWVPVSADILHRLLGAPTPAIGISTTGAIVGFAIALTVIVAMGAAIARLLAARAELARMAYSDPMTGLANYRAFRQIIHDECERSERYGHSLSMLLIDIDWFKRVNDQHGHPAGDEVLRQVAAILQEHVRSIDIVARYGGEEFAVLCPGTDTEAAATLAERLRVAVQGGKCVLPTGEPLTITISVGAAVRTPDAASEMDLIVAADSALYDAKHAGRNRVARAAPTSNDKWKLAATNGY